jgi:hypothetical protein
VGAHFCAEALFIAGCGGTAIHDTSSGPDDTSSVDTGRSVESVGTITGDCDVIGGALGDDTPSLFRNVLDFGKSFDESLLGEGAQEVLADGNLGGSSLYSEAIAFEVLEVCEHAELLKTEAEIDYADSGGKKTDLLVAIEGAQIGVSVTRAYHYPPEEGMSEEDASSLLEGKLSDILLSAENATGDDVWTRSILQVIAWDAGHADAVTSAYEALDTQTLDQTLVFVTVTNGDDDALY